MPAHQDTQEEHAYHKTDQSSAHNQYKDGIASCSRQRLGCRPPSASRKAQWQTNQAGRYAEHCTAGHTEMGGDASTTMKTNAHKCRTKKTTIPWECAPRKRITQTHKTLTMKHKAGAEHANVLQENAKHKHTEHSPRKHKAGASMAHNGMKQNINKKDTRTGSGI